MFLSKMLINPKEILDCYRKIAVSRSEGVTIEALMMGIGLMAKISLVDLVILSLFKNPSNTLVTYHIQTAHALSLKKKPRNSLRRY
jgi:hypothetical protein